LEASEFEAVRAALEMGWLGMGSYVGEFEAACSRLMDLGERRAVAVSTGHAALHLALAVAGVGPGDEVITPAFNNVADFQAILAVGADPVFCDISDETLCIDLDQAETLVSPRTKAIIVMDYDCILCDHDRVAKFAEKHGVRVIHDAAHAFGSRYQGRAVGSFSDITIFSFDPVKTITCIDGGLVVVRTEEEDRTLREMRLIGMGQPSSLMYQNRRAWTYDVSRMGFRYHMANLHAALGLSQLAKFDRIAATRREASRRYSRELANLSDVRLPASTFEDIVPFLYYIRVPASRRDALRAYLSDSGIDTGIHWQPGHWFSLFNKCRRGDLTITDRVGHEILSLPLHSEMEESDLSRVVKSIRLFFSR
jgi:dTDP-4-amino-4,6-dideoxygalactose transaminase